MLPVAEAQARVLAPLSPLPPEWVTLREALGRVLSADLAAKRDQPPVAVSAMDGFAVRAADTAQEGRPFCVIGEAPAGSDLDRALEPCEAARIFTGGALPPGADAIVIQENAEVSGDQVRFSGPAVAPGTFVRPAGLDFAQGWTGLKAGTLLDATAELPGADVPVGTGLLDALVATGLVDSKKAARRAISDGAVSVNGTKVSDEQFVLGPGDYLHGRVAVLRRGRRNLAAARQR